MKSKALLVILALLIPQLLSATPVTFDLRAESIEDIDEVNSFSLTIDGLTAVLKAVPETFDGHTLVLNRTASGFGVNVEDTTCGGTEKSAEIDGVCIGESVQIVFASDVFLNSLTVSIFGGSDEGLVSIGSTPYYSIESTGLHDLGGVFLAAGTPWSVAYTAGNGFSFDNFTATQALPEPSTLSLLGFGLVGGCLVRWRILRRRSMHSFC